MSALDRFPLHVGWTWGPGLFKVHNTRKVTVQRFGSRYFVRQDASVINQRGKFGFSALLGAQPYLTAKKKDLGTALTTHTTVTMVLRTKKIYYDSDAVSAWVRTDGPGFGVTKDQQVRLVLTRVGNGGGTKTLQCGWIWYTQGHHCIKSLAQTEWFSESGDVTVTVHAEIQGTAYKTQSSKLTLAKKRCAGGLKTVGAYVSLPSFPVVAGDQFTAKLYASTHAKNVPPRKYFALQVVHVRIAYDKVFTLKSAVSSLYSGKIETKNAMTSEKKPFSTSEWVYTQKVSDSKQVTGDSVLLATLTFEVAQNAPKRDVQDVPFSVTVVGMDSGAGLKVVEYKAGSVYDHQGEDRKSVV